MSLPWHTWARTGYQGCLEDVRINGALLDFSQVLTLQVMLYTIICVMRFMMKHRLHETNQRIVNFILFYISLTKISPLKCFCFCMSYKSCTLFQVVRFYTLISHLENILIFKKSLLILTLSLNGDDQLISNL